MKKRQKVAIRLFHKIMKNKLKTKKDNKWKKKIKNFKSHLTAKC